jgi:putative tryptophan/tyrosine transport system substrate-binding protein
MMRRRNLIVMLGGAAVAWPTKGRAQQSVLPVIGFLSSKAPSDAPKELAAFRQGLRDTGFAEGQNFTIEYRYAGNQNSSLLALAADLVHRQVNVIVAAGTPAALAAKAATTSIPIVFEGDSTRFGSALSRASTGRAVASPAWGK